MALKKNYTNLQINLYKDSIENQKPSIETRSKTVYVSEDLDDYSEVEKSNNPKQPVYVNADNAYTALQMLDSIRIEYPILISSCNVSDNVFLEKFKTILMEFIGEGSHKWNFLTIDHYTRLKAGVTTYELPENFDKIISVSLESDCSLNPYNRPLELTYLDYQKTSFISGKNYYSIKNNEITFYNSTINNKLEKCNHCGECSDCKKFMGNVNLKYHITAPLPLTMDEPMNWMKQHAFFYLKSKMVLSLYIVAEQVPPQSIQTQADNLFHNLQSWDSNLVPVQNKQINNRRIFDYSGLLSK